MHSFRLNEDSWDCYGAERRKKTGGMIHATIYITKKYRLLNPFINTPLVECSSAMYCTQQCIYCTVNRTLGWVQYPRRWLFRSLAIEISYSIVTVSVSVSLENANRDDCTYNLIDRIESSTI